MGDGPDGRGPDAAAVQGHAVVRDQYASCDLRAPLVHRTDRDFAVAYTKTYGNGRVFYSTLGHPRELWDAAWLQKMYFEALKWSMGLSESKGL